MIDLAELPVQRNRTLRGSGLAMTCIDWLPSNTQAGTRAAGDRPLVYPDSNPRPKTRVAFACLSGPRHRSPTGLAYATTPILPSTGRRDVMTSCLGGRRVVLLFRPQAFPRGQPYLAGGTHEACFPDPALRAPRLPHLFP